MQENPFSQGPYLAVAVLCEKVLVERDGVFSAIRLVDRINRSAVGAEAPAVMEPFDYQLYMFLSFKSESARGPMTLDVRMEKPSGSSVSPTHQTVNFEGDDERGINLVTDVRIRFEEPGLYWFHVFLDSQRMTRIPMRVV